MSILATTKNVWGITAIPMSTFSQDTLNRSYLLMWQHEGILHFNEKLYSHILLCISNLNPIVFRNFKVQFYINLHDYGLSVTPEELTGQQRNSTITRN